jgi:hypothetical protein
MLANLTKQKELRFGCWDSDLLMHKFGMEPPSTSFQIYKLNEGKGVQVKTKNVWL